jgi:predicted nucleic acid-binding protein
VDRGVIVADTEVLLDLLEWHGAHAKVIALLRAGRLATTAVTVFEIWRGPETEGAREIARRAFRASASARSPLTGAAARRAEEVRRALRGAPIGERDTLIAGVCLAIQRPLLSANIRHSRRVPGLEVVQAR